MVIPRQTDEQPTAKPEGRLSITEVGTPTGALGDLAAHGAGLTVEAAARGFTDRRAPESVAHMGAIGAEVEGAHDLPQQPVDIPRT